MERSIVIHTLKRIWNVKIIKRPRQAIKFVYACITHAYHLFLYQGTEPLQATRRQWWKRVAVCHNNLCGVYDYVEDECLKCECVVARKAKWLDFDCPKNLWDKSVLPTFLRDDFCDE